MSQEKVDRYKKEKANRAQLLKKEKRIRRLEYTAVALVAAVMIGWVGFSVYQKASQTDAPAETYTMDTTALNTYISGLAE